MFLLRSLAIFLHPCYYTKILCLTMWSARFISPCLRSQWRCLVDQQGLLSSPSPIGSSVCFWWYLWWQVSRRTFFAVIQSQFFWLAVKCRPCLESTFLPPGCNCLNAELWSQPGSKSSPDCLQPFDGTNFVHCVIICSSALPFRTSLHLLPRLLHESYFGPTMLVSGEHFNAHSVVDVAVRIRIRKTDRESAKPGIFVYRWGCKAVTWVLTFMRNILADQEPFRRNNQRYDLEYNCERQPWSLIEASHCTDVWARFSRDY